MFSLVQFLLLVFYKRKHLEIGPTEFGNLWISDRFFDSQCESFEELKFKCNNTIGNPAMGTSDLPCHRTGPFAVLLVLASVPRETRLLVVSLLHKTRHQGHARVFPAWMAALLKVYEIHEREDERDHSRGTWWYSRWFYLSSVIPSCQRALRRITCLHVYMQMFINRIHPFSFKMINQKFREKLSTLIHKVPELYGVATYCKA